MQFPNLLTHEAVKPRLIRTFFYLLLYLLGLNILLPFVPAEMLYYQDYVGGDSLAKSLNAMNERSTFTHNVSILAQGVSAYYLASLIAALIIPILYRNKEGNERSIRRWVKGLTLVIALLQAASYSKSISANFFGFQTPAFALLLTWLVLVAGAMACMWIADKISEQGLMDGRILLLCIELFIGFPSALFTELSNKLLSGQLLQLGIEVGAWFAILVGIVALTQAIRYIPLKFKEGQEKSGEKLEKPTLRVHFNMVDEFPLGLATYFNFLAILPLIVTGPDNALARMLLTFSNPASLPAMAVAFCFIFLATYIFVAVVLAPRYYTELLEEWDASIPGAKEEGSWDFFRQLFNRLGFPLAVFLGIIGILPGLSVFIFNATPGFSTYFGGFSLFLIISLVTDFFSKVEQTAQGASSIVGRSTTPELGLAYELEIGYEKAAGD